MNTVNKLSNGKYKVENIFLTIALIFGLITVFIQPIFSAPDEFVHFKRAYTIFHDDTDKLFEQVNQLTVVIPYDGPELNENGLNSPEASFAFESAYKDGSFIQKYFKEEVSSLGKIGFNIRFERINLLPQAIGILLGSLIHPSFGIMIIIGRLFNFFVYVLSIYWAIKKSKVGKWFMATVALLPISIQQAASLSYDVLYYVVIFACFSLLTNLWTRKERLNWKWLLGILSIFFLLLVPKASVLVLFLYFLALPTCLFGKNIFTRYIDKFWGFWNNHKKLAAVVIAFIFYSLFVYEFRQSGGAIRGMQIILNTFFRPDFYNNMDSVLVSGMIGNFGQLTYRLPAWLIIINFVFLFIIGLSEKEVNLENRVAVTSFVAYTLVILMTAITMYMSWTLRYLNIAGALISLGNQGRYYTPFLITVIPLFFQVKKYFKLEIKEEIVYVLFKILLIFNLLYFLLLTYMFYYLPDRGANFLPDIVDMMKAIF